jgi:proteasome lid subunit RPN8/RPN11
MSSLEGIAQVAVPKEVTEKTQLFLRQVGRSGKEGMVLWVGTQEGARFQVTTPLIPRQRGISTKDGVCVIVDSDEMHRINKELFESGLRLIAQVHSHPTDAYHSDTDDEFAIANTIGCLSLVVPDFASRDFDLSDCAVYRLDRTGSWREVEPAQLKALLVIEGI